jgi:hypothetical protein
VRQEFLTRALMKKKTDYTEGGGSRLLDAFVRHLILHQGISVHLDFLITGLLFLYY